MGFYFHGLILASIFGFSKILGEYGSLARNKFVLIFQIIVYVYLPNGRIFIIS